jgi:hypothetical protein
MNQDFVEMLAAVASGDPGRSDAFPGKPILQRVRGGG